MKIPFENQSQFFFCTLKVAISFACVIISGSVLLSTLHAKGHNDSIQQIGTYIQVSNENEIPSHIKCNRIFEL